MFNNGLAVHLYVCISGLFVMKLEDRLQDVVSKIYNWKCIEENGKYNWKVFI